MKKKLLLPLAVLIAAAILLLWYLRPRGIAQVLPGFDREAVSFCDAFLLPLYPPFSSQSSQSVSLDCPSAEYDQLMDLLSSADYRRGLEDLLHLGRAADSQAITIDPYIHLSLYQDAEHHWALTFYGRQIVVQDLSSGVSRTFIPFRGSTFQREVADFLSGCLDQAEN